MIKKAPRVSPLALYAQAVKLFRAHYWDRAALNIQEPKYRLDTPADAARAISELVNSLNDRYTLYREPAAAHEMRRTRNSVIEGIGVSLNPVMKDGKPVCTSFGKELAEKSRGGFPLIGSIFKGTPAEKVALCAGDEVISIDGKSTKRILKLVSLARRIRGPKGSVIELGIRRLGIVEKVTIVRDKYWIPSMGASSDLSAAPDGGTDEQTSLLSSATKSGIGYLRVMNFIDPHVPMRVRTSLLRLQDCHSLVLDLRDNAGGSVLAAMNIVQLFVREGTILRQEMRHADRVSSSSVSVSEGQLFSSTDGAEQIPIDRQFKCLWYKPVVILVNGKTASAAELVAGTMSELVGALILGETTFGKGIIQSGFTLINGGLLELTTGVYKLPSGKWLGDAAGRRIGITPDEVVVNARSVVESGTILSGASSGAKENIGTVEDLQFAAAINRLSLIAARSLTV